MKKHSFCIASIANRDHPSEIMNSIANHDRQPPPTSTGPHSPNHQRLIYLWLSGELQLQKPPPTMSIAPATFAALPPTTQREMASPPLLANNPANTTRKTSPYPQATKAHSPSPSGNRSTLPSPTSTANPASPTANPRRHQPRPTTRQPALPHHQFRPQKPPSNYIYRSMATAAHTARPSKTAPSRLPAHSTARCQHKTTHYSPNLVHHPKLWFPHTLPKLERENPSPTTLAILTPEMPRLAPG